MQSFSVQDIFICSQRTPMAVAEDITQVIGEAAYIDTAMLIQLPDNRLAKLTLAHSDRTYIHEPDAILVSIMSKTAGKLDGQLFAFKDYLVCKNGQSIAPAGYALKQYRTSGDTGIFRDINPTNASVETLISEMVSFVQAYA